MLLPCSLNSVMSFTSSSSAGELLVCPSLVTAMVRYMACSRGNTASHDTLEVSMAGMMGRLVEEVAEGRLVEGLLGSAPVKFSNFC